MRFPLHITTDAIRHQIKQGAQGNKRYPMVLMLEPLYTCNLACIGCAIERHTGKLEDRMALDECLKAVDESQAPIVSLCGGEPTIYPELKQLVEGIIERKRHIYLCTNAILLEEKLNEFTPSKYLTFSIHMDGPKKEHDFAVCKEGVYDVAVSAIKAAVARGFRVTTNTTLFDGADPKHYEQFFDDMMALGVEGMMLSPGYSYQKAPDQEHFLQRQKTQKLFTELLKNRKKNWKFNLSPLFLEFLQGRVDFECTPWGNPTYNIFGWQKPCYLLQEGYVQTFKELMELTEWDKYGHKSGNEKCKDCMVHCGYEPTAVDETFGSIKGFARTAKAAMAHGL